MRPINQIWSVFTLRDKKLNSFILIATFTMAAFIGAFGAIIPSLLSGGQNSNGSLDDSAGSNLGYEECITATFDKYGNLTVLGSFQGPQVTPDVNWALTGYDTVWAIALEAVNPNTGDYLHQYEAQILNPDLPKQDVYLHFYFLNDPQDYLANGMINPIILSETEMHQTAANLKDDLEIAFGIQNNFTSTPVGSKLKQGFYHVITYGFNYTLQIDYDYFLQYFSDHTPAGLADSFSSPRINMTRSWLEWRYSNNFFLFEQYTCSGRSPFADFTKSFECNVHLKYPQYYGPNYPSSENYTFDLSTVTDAPFTPLASLFESAYSTSEINIAIENGRITSSPTSPYHIPQLRGADADYWLLLNASMYNTLVDGAGTLLNVKTNFTTPIVLFNVLTPLPGPIGGDVPISVQMNTSFPFPSAIFAFIYDVPTFKQEIFDDLAFATAIQTLPLTYIPLLHVGGGLYSGLWQNTYIYPNKDYYIYIYNYFTGLSDLPPRSGYYPFGMVYNYTRITLNNPGQIQLDIETPQPYDEVTKTLSIATNISSPEPILSVTYEIYNYTQLRWSWFMAEPMDNGSLSNPLATYWVATWDSIRVQSTYDYVLRIKVTDTNTTFFKDVPITVNNTFFQENIPIYAPMGSSQTYGYDLLIGTIEPPQVWDPFEGGGGGGPMPHTFFGYGVDFGVDFLAQKWKDTVGCFIMADNDHTDNPLWTMIDYDMPVWDFGITVMLPSEYPNALQTANALRQDVEAAFNIPSELTLLATRDMQMGPGIYVTFFNYAGNYSSITYEDFIDKFHNSVPNGLAQVFTTENMTQSTLNSSLFFGWINPDGLWGQQFFPYSPYKTYNLGKGVFISPVIQFPNYFDDTIAQVWDVSLKDLFPQLPQIKSCDPSVASTILSGFGPNFIGMPAGLNVLNSNITNWYPKDPLMINVTPLIGTISPFTLNSIIFTMLNTENIPFGLRATDDISFQFIGPYVTNNLLSPTAHQSISLDFNVTITSESIGNDWNKTQYYIQKVGEDQSSVFGQLSYNGNNWTDSLNSLYLESGLYRVITYSRENWFNMWAMSETYFYVNNSARISTLDIYINDLGDVEIGYNTPSMGLPSFGYGIDLGINPELYNSTDLYAVSICFSEENTPNRVSTVGTGDNWNVLVTINGMIDVDTNDLERLAVPIIADLERIFDIPGLLQPLEMKDVITTGPFNTIMWGMNYTPSRNYEYFLNHYETVRNGNISGVVSKENILKADQSYIEFAIYPTWVMRQSMPYWGYPANGNYGEMILPVVWMKFTDVFDYSTLNQIHQFSLADLLDISQINTDSEQTLTYAYVDLFTFLTCGDYVDIYPNITPYTNHLGGSGGMDIYQFLLLTKNNISMAGMYQTDDIRFNFTAPYTIIDIYSPISGTTVHGDVSVVANATMLYPSTRNAKVDIYNFGAFDAIPIQYLPIDSFNLTYDPVNNYWEGCWETLEDIDNGWYDLIITFKDGLGNPQRNYTRVYVCNTYYSERLDINVDQWGNITAYLEFQGSPINHALNHSITEYDSTLMVNFVAFNAFNGHDNYSKELYADFLSYSSMDFGFTVMTPLGISAAEAIALSNPIKADMEQIFDIPGVLNFVTTDTMAIDVGGGQYWMFRYVIYGANYTPFLTYDHFIQKFHQSTPDGLNNTIPAATLSGTDSLLMWISFLNESFAFMQYPPTMGLSPTMVSARLFYPQYFGSGFMGPSLQSHDLSLSTLFNIPEIVHASNTIADSLSSDVNILVENANITRISHDIPGASWVQWPSNNEYRVELASRRSFESWNNVFDPNIFDFPSWADINITFSSPITRPIFIDPLPGTVVDGNLNINVYVENSTPVDIQNVEIKIYTDTEFQSIDSRTIMGGSSSMPNARPAGFYGSQMINDDDGDGIYNDTLDVSGFPDGQYWVETVIYTQNELYSYNSSPITISNSNPFLINILSPSKDDIITGPFEIVVEVINSTPILQVMGAIADEFAIEGIAQFLLEPRGGGIYAASWGSHGLPNGTYLIAAMAFDMNFNYAINFSVTVEFQNPNVFEISIIDPLDSLNWGPAVITALASSPYPVTMMQYEILQCYYNPQWNEWSGTGTIASGLMVDPDSTWQTAFDTTFWSYKVQDGSNWYDAYYQINIWGTDVGNTTSIFIQRFPLAPAPIDFATITSPTPGSSLSGIDTITVEVTNGTDTINWIAGEFRPAYGDTPLEFLSFSINGSGQSADAVINTYPYPVGFYTLAVWGETGQGSFYDEMRVGFSNAQIYSMEVINPEPWEAYSGLMTVQVDITNFTNFEFYDSNVRLGWGDYVASLYPMEYNMSSGFWESQLDTTILLDGEYRVEFSIQDENKYELRAFAYFTVDNPPHVTLLSPAPFMDFVEYEPINFIVQIPDTDMDRVELWNNLTHIMDFTQNGEIWTATWSDTIGYEGLNLMIIKAYDLGGMLNQNQTVWVNITHYTPPFERADVYEVTITDENGTAQTTFTDNQTIEYHTTVRGDIGGNTYIVTAQTDSPALRAYLQYNESVTVLPGQDIDVVFDFTIVEGAPTGIYTVNICVWTAWPWDGGICVDFIIITFEVV